MTRENNRSNSPCLQGICRRDFLKLAVAAGLLAGCNAAQQPTAAPLLAPTAAATTVSVEDFSQVAYCGMRCQTCPVLRAHNCDGCKSESGRLCPSCQTCTIRPCAMAKQVATCAHCDEFPSCDDSMWEIFPHLRVKAKQIRSSLKAQPNTSGNP